MPFQKRAGIKSRSHIARSNTGVEEGANHWIGIVPKEPTQRIHGGLGTEDFEHHRRHLPDVFVVTVQ